MNVPQNVLMKVRLRHVLELSTRAIRVANNLGGEKGTSNFNSLLILLSSFLPQPAVNILIERFDHHAQFNLLLLLLTSCIVTISKGNKQTTQPTVRKMILSLYLFKAQVYST